MHFEDQLATLRGASRWLSDEAPEQSSKTEDPSQKKLEDAHKKGDVVKSQEVTTWFMLRGLGADLCDDGAVDERQPHRSPQGRSSPTPISSRSAAPAFGAVLRRPRRARSCIVALIPLRRSSRSSRIAANLVQHRPLLSLDPITPKALQDLADRRLPSRLFSTEALVNFAKGLAQARRRRRGAVLRAVARARPARDHDHRRSGDDPRRSSRRSGSRSSARRSRSSPSSRSPTTSTSATSGGSGRR